MVRDGRLEMMGQGTQGLMPPGPGGEQVNSLMSVWELR
jgi:hypothetical protein